MPKKPLTNIEIQKRLDALERRGMNTGGNVLSNYTGTIQLPGGGTLNMDTLNKQIAAATEATNPVISTNPEDKTLAADSKVSDPFGALAANSFMKDDGKGNIVFDAAGDGTEFGAAVQANNTDAENIKAAADAKASTVTGGAGNDTVTGGAGNDTVTGDERLQKKEKTVLNVVPLGDGRSVVYYSDGTSETIGTKTETETETETGTGTGGGTGTGTGTGGLESRFGDVLNQYDQMAGLTGTNPDLTTNAKIDPTDMVANTNELETTAGVQVGATQQAATEIISDAQIQALQAAGYTLKTDADTVTGTTNTINDVTAQALSAQTLNTLTDSVDPQTGKRIVGESIIGQIPDKESIDQKAAQGALAIDMDGADRSKTPTVGDYTGDFNTKINAAQRSITTNEIVQPIDPRTANQGPAQVMAELRDNAVMEAAQSSTDEQTRATANAITQQMSEVPIEATVQGQLTNLMAQFADGKTPAYAAGAIRNAEAQMAARGLSASSMAGAAIMQSAMEASIPIAAQDAQVFREINLSNINNKQKVALANAAAGLQIGLADLNARQQEQLQNSTNAFSLQSQSLTNMQQASLANAQLRAALQERELGFEQQRQVLNATRYAEIEGINLTNQQQGILQDSVNNMQVTASNMSFKQQRELSKAQIDAALTGQELTNDQQAAVVNAARIAEVNNMIFTEEQQRNLNNSQLMQNMTLANLDADMKAALSDASTYASMEMANLTNKQQAQVVNAQSFLNLDMASLSNKQQAEVLKYQAKTQSIFTDAAADNARLQFNATSENQVDQFFAQLGMQTAQQNSNRVAAMKQFNSDQTNAQARFNSTLTDTREKFNSTMQAQINQSNAAWRRQINTQNTSTQNEANRQNALNVFGQNQNALNNIWQQYRDESSWLFTQNLTREQFGHELVKLSMQGDISKGLFNHKLKAKSWQDIGGAAMTWLATELGLVSP